MKFEEYMKQQRLKMKEENKLLVFGEIQNKIQRESIFSKVFLYSKVSIYSLLVFFVIFGLFIKTDNTRYSSKDLTIKNNINTVNAAYVWKVIKSEWDFDIIDNGKKINKNLIEKWDIISLWINANISLKVNKGINLYLIWPARLKVDYYVNNEGIKIYTLDMLDGNYISVTSNLPSDKIILKSNILNIESNDKLIDLRYQKRWNAVIVENNGWNILIKNNKKIFSLKKKEKIIIWERNLNKIKNILNSNYKNYKVDENWTLKTILSSDKLKKLWNILERKNIIIAVWKYVLWSVNKDNNWRTSWKKQLIKTINNTYNLLNIKEPHLIKNKLQKKQDINIQELEVLVDNLISKINKNYILIDQYKKRLKIILAYLVIIEKINIKEWIHLNNLSSLVNYLQLNKKYKKILLQF